MNCLVNAICAGSGRAIPSGKVSGIAKSPLEGKVAIGLRGIEADEQVNRVHHGYPPMALHHYPAENHAWLLERFGPLPRLAGPGSMGENIATQGLSEHDVQIGDRFRLGTALIEVSQPRQPCSTIEGHLGTKGIVKAVVASARSGWFYRVIEPGTAAAGDALQKVDEGNARWPVARAFLAVYGSSLAPEGELRELAALDRVSERLVHDIGKRITL